MYIYAVTFSTGVGKTGDAANITASISKDGGAQAATGTTNPTEIGHGVYWFPLTQAETNADSISVAAISSTSGVTIEAILKDTLPGSATALLAQLADAVAHGGTLGSSTATLALDRVQIKTTGTNIPLRITAVEQNAVILENNSTTGFSTLQVFNGGTNGNAADFVCFGGAGFDCVRMFAGAAAALGLYGPGVGSAPAIKIDNVSTDTGGSGGDGISIAVDGANSNGIIINSAARNGIDITAGNDGIELNTTQFGIHATTGNSFIYCNATGSGFELHTGQFGIFASSSSQDAIKLIPAAGKLAINSPTLFDGVTVETGLNARQALSMISSATAGVLSGAATTAVTIKGCNVATTRIQATVDASGNRSAITLTIPP